MTWKQLTAWATRELRSCAIDAPEENAHYLALGVLRRWSRSELRALLDSDVTPEEAACFRAMVARRATHEPLQYILGEWEFFGLRLRTEPGVLIPRPETEHVVEEGLAEAAMLQRPLTILDLGTGSGAIALALATTLPTSTIIGIDLSEAAIRIAEANRTLLGLHNVTFMHADLLREDWLERLGVVPDIIVSNPPYIPIEEYEELEPEVRQFEPRIALTDESDGYTFYERILTLAAKLLPQDGRLIMELGYNSAPRVKELARTAGIETIRIVPDLAGILRVFVGARGETRTSVTK